MTVQEAKEILEYYEKQEWFFEKDQPAKNAFTMAIESMKELEQYRALGTVEELKEAREKQIAKKPIWIKRSVTKFQVCPCCSNAEHYQMIFKSQKYCSECGQALKWGEEDD